MLIGSGIFCILVRIIVRLFKKIRIIYVDISNKKQCEKHCHRKPKVCAIKDYLIYTLSGDS